MPVRSERIVLADDFEGFELTVRTNPPLRVINLLASQEIGDLILALSEIILDWNFVDEEGEPLPPPSQETIAELPMDLVVLIAEHYQEAVNRLPPPTRKPS